MNHTRAERERLARLYWRKFEETGDPNYRDWSFFYAPAGELPPLSGGGAK